MIPKKMLEALNAQVGEEFHSAFLYLAMSAWCDSKTFKGFSRWLRVQFQEEQTHALKLVDHIIDRGGSLSLSAIPAPTVEFKSLTECFEAVLGHERHVTEKVHALHDLAVREHDVAAQVFMQWYVTEQIEEEAHSSEILEKLKMVGDRPGAALYLDKEYGKRGSKD